MQKIALIIIKLIKAISQNINNVVPNPELLLCITTGINKDIKTKLKEKLNQNIFHVMFLYSEKMLFVFL